MPLNTLGCVEPSPEIEAVFRRLMEALRAGDVEAVRNLFSNNAHVRLILTGEDEWWHAHDEAAGLVLARSRESGIVRYEFERLEGFERGRAPFAASQQGARSKSSFLRASTQSG